MTGAVDEGNGLAAKFRLNAIKRGGIDWDNSLSISSRSSQSLLLSSLAEEGELDFFFWIFTNIIGKNIVRHHHYLHLLAELACYHCHNLEHRINHPHLKSLHVAQIRGLSCAKMGPTHQSAQYRIAHVSWDVTGYQGLFCPSNKTFYDRWLGCVRGVKSSGRVVIIC